MQRFAFRKMAGGSGGYDQVDLAGKIADWNFVANADGSITATHAVHGQDTLQDIDGIWFNDEATWHATADLVA